MKMAWWDTYFDELYLRMFNTILTPERTAQEVAGVMILLSLPPGARVLDLCCGQGRHAVPLARAGYRVTGLDRSPYLLGRARRAAARAGAEIDWVQGDMRSLPWREHFDACINLFTAFGYFEEEGENQEVLHQVYRSLKPGGQLFLDIANRDYHLLRLLPAGWQQNGEAIILEDPDFDPITGRFTTTFTWIEGDRRESLTHSVRHYTVPEIKSMLHRAALPLAALHGDFDGCTFDIDSRRLIAIARKDARGEQDEPGSDLYRGSSAIRRGGDDRGRR
jgi:SAM-dependent methyltransferase